MAAGARLGALAARVLRVPQSTTRRLVDAVPGVPKGPYVVIQFTTEFQKRASAIETITPALGTDGRWRVSGYFIK